MLAGQISSTFALMPSPLSVLAPTSNRPFVKQASSCFQSSRVQGRKTPFPAPCPSPNSIIPGEICGDCSVQHAHVLIQVDLSFFNSGNVFAGLLGTSALFPMTPPKVIRCALWLTDLDIFQDATHLSAVGDV